MSGLAHRQFTRILEEISNARSRNAAVDIFRSAKFSGQIGALSNSQKEQLQDAIREIGEST